MKYDITKNKAPQMPNLGKGTECIKFLLSQASKTMLFHLYSDVFYPTWHPCGCFLIIASRPHLLELCGQMANLVAETGSIKG
jgi:hypothetical protein